MGLQNARLDALMGVSIAKLPCAMSSQRVRFEPSGMATWLLNKVSRVLDVHTLPPSPTFLEP